MKSKTLSFAGILLLFLLSSIAYPAIGSNLWLTPETEIAELYISGEDFAPTVQRNHADTFVAQADGLSLADAQQTSVFTSDVIEAPISFNVVVPQWITEVPESASFMLSVRTGNGRSWGEWQPVHENHDWTRPEDPDTVGEMVIVPAADITHQYLQYRVSLGRYSDGQTPRLKELHFTFIDSTAGPTQQEMEAQQQAHNAAQANAAPESYAKPNVISRAVWCVEAGCDYSNGLEYEPVTHLIVHHTVTSNDSANWPAVVRAIWKFHKDSRGWGDIGYNYLVDMNGVLYEGHNGGDDVIGTHASDANRGSMALALIGNFTLPTHTMPGIQPPQPMLNSAANLFAWKADQKHIDVYGAGRLPNMSWGLPNLMGHRDVYGGTNTECPGDQAYLLLPWLRDEVAKRLNFQPDYIHIDELSSNFTRSNQGSWYEGPKGCGNEGHSYYTWSVTDPNASTNWGEWRLPVPVDGIYEIEVYAPYCKTNRSETDGATYRITHANGTETAVISHDDHVGLWMSLGEYPLTANGSGKVRLTDLTATDSGRGVWFDGLRLRLVNGTLPQTPTLATSQPQPDSWQTQREVAFAWTAENSSTVTKTWLQVATDPEFKQMVVDQSWDGLVLSQGYTFPQDYAHLYWRAVVATPTTTVVSPVVHFGIDSEAPQTAVTNIFHLGWDSRTVVSWRGSDTASGLAGYNVDYRIAGTADWTAWLTNTNRTAAAFTPPAPGQIYEFRSQGIDKVGHLEPLPVTADTNSQQAKSLPHAIMLTNISNNN